MPELMLVLPGSIRSKKNSKMVIKAGGRWIIIPSTAYRKWEKQARKCSIEQGGNRKLTCDVHVKVSAFYKGQRPDLSGVLESVGDCLEGIVWVNDRQIVSWDGSCLIHDKDNPRTWVTVSWSEADSGKSGNNNLNLEKDG